MEILFIAALIPVAALGYFIYINDIHTEPGGVLAKIFGLGCLSVIPAVIMEMVFHMFFPTDKSTNFLIIFINTFIAVALIEETCKWTVAKKFGYNSDSFDEIYDVIVYSVFASLGFAAIENLKYVLNLGLINAFVRAIYSIPGHACFGVLMGYYLAKAKISANSGNKSLYNRYIVFSVLFPTLAHAMFDAILFYSRNIGRVHEPFYFYLFFIALVAVCFVIVRKLSKMQQNLTTGVKKGNIVVPNNENLEVSNDNIEFCPICGKNVKGLNYCPYCGIKLKK